MNDGGFRIFDKFNESDKVVMSAAKHPVILTTLLPTNPELHEEVAKDAATSWALCGTTVVGN